MRGIQTRKWPRRAVKPITAPMKLILRLLSEMPLASVSELGARSELAGISRPSVEAHLVLLCQRDYVGSFSRGWCQRNKQRFFLHEKGVARVTVDDGIPSEWSDTEVALLSLLRQGPMVELAYDVAPRLSSSNAVVENWRNGFPLSRFRWVSRGPVSAVAEYEPNLLGDDFGARLLAPHIWYGIRPKPNPLPADSAQFLSGIAMDKIDDTGPLTRPCGVVILAADRLAGLRARRDLPPGIPRSIITIKDRFGGSLIESMDPVSRLDRIIGAGTPPKNPGRPEKNRYRILST